MNTVKKWLKCAWNVFHPETAVDSLCMHEKNNISQSDCAHSTSATATKRYVSQLFTNIRERVAAKNEDVRGLSFCSGDIITCTCTEVLIKGQTRRIFP